MEKFDEGINSEDLKNFGDYESKSLLPEKESLHHDKFSDYKDEKYQIFKNPNNQEFLKSIAKKYQNKNYSESKDYKSKSYYSHCDNNEHTNEYISKLRYDNNFKNENINENVERKTRNKVFFSNIKSKFLYTQMRIKEEEDILGKKIEILKNRIQKIKFSDDYHNYDEENFETIFNYYDDMILIAKGLTLLIKIYNILSFRFKSNCR